MQKPRRIEIMDEIRGFCIVLMVLYHALYDVVFILKAEYLKDLFNKLSILQPFFAAVFVVISGMACRLSRSNARRGIELLAVSFLLTAATRFFIPEQTIYFGIIHMLAFSILIFAIARPLLDKISPVFGVILSGVLFFSTYGIQYGYIGIENIYKISLSKKLFDYLYLYPVGLPHKSFTSADYFPLIPWLFMFLAGTYLGVYLKKGRKLPKGIYKRRFPFLAFIGRHSLVVYLLHQPVLYGLFWVGEYIASFL